MVDDRDTESMPRLTSARIRNFRLFSDETLTLESAVTVLVGRNDTGKSTALEALTIFGRATRGGSLRELLKSEDLRQNGAGSTRFTVSWVQGSEPWTHELILDPAEPLEAVQSQASRWSWSPKERVLDFDGRRFEAKDLPRFSSLAAIGQSDWQTDTEVPPEVYQPLSSLALLRLPVTYLFQSEALASLMPRQDEPGRSGFGWASWLQKIINRRDGTMDMIERRLRKLFPFMGKVLVREEAVEIRRTRRVTGAEGEANEDDGVRRKGRNADVLSSLAEAESGREVFFQIEKEGRSFLLPARKASSGILLALAHLALIYASDEGAILALEEPENGLNAQITYQMIEVLLDAIRERKQQVLLTTHNGWWLDAVPRESIRVFTRDRDGAHIQIPEAPLLEETLKREDIHASEVFHAFGPEGLLRAAAGHV